MYAETTADVTFEIGSFSYWCEVTARYVVETDGDGITSPRESYLTFDEAWVSGGDVMVGDEFFGDLESAKLPESFHELAVGQLDMYKIKQRAAEQLLAR